MTPFSRINLEGRPNFDECLETMNVELEEAVLVIRGRVNGQTVEFMVGDLKTDGPRNGMVLIHEAEYHDVFHGGSALAVARYANESHRILLDCELRPDKNEHAYSIKVTEEQQ